MTRTGPLTGRRRAAPGLASRLGPERDADGLSTQPRTTIEPERRCSSRGLAGAEMRGVQARPTRSKPRPPYDDSSRSHHTQCRQGARAEWSRTNGGLGSRCERPRGGAKPASSLTKDLNGGRCVLERDRREQKRSEMRDIAFHVDFPCRRTTFIGRSRPCDCGQERPVVRRVSRPPALPLRHPGSWLARAESTRTAPVGLTRAILSLPIASCLPTFLSPHYKNARKGQVWATGGHVRAPPRLLRGLKSTTSVVELVDLEMRSCSNSPIGSSCVDEDPSPPRGRGSTEVLGVRPCACEAVEARRRALARDAAIRRRAVVPGSNSLADLPVDRVCRHTRTDRPCLHWFGGRPRSHRCVSSS